MTIQITPLAADYSQGGKGCYLYDVRGKAYLDGSGGAAVSRLGMVIRM